MLQASTLGLVMEIFKGLIQCLDLFALLRGHCRIHEVLDHQGVFHLGQVADHGAAETDQEPGKHHRHQPQATAEPFF